MPLLVFRMSLKPQQLQELPIVRPILKDILMIDTPEHHVVYTCTTLFSWFSWHSFSKCCCKDKEKTTNRQKKVHKSTQKEPSLLCTRLQISPQTPLSPRPGLESNDRANVASIRLRLIIKLTFPETKIPRRVFIGCCT